MPDPLVGLLASRVRVDEKLLFAALERAGVRCEHIDTRRLTPAIPVVAPLYDVVLSREISHTRASYATAILAAAGVSTINAPAVIDLCGDKVRTTLVLVQHGIPTPRTAVALTPEAALAAVEDIGYPCVLKPPIGSWGRLLALVRDPDTARTVLEHRAALPSPPQRVVYVQQYIDKPGRDIRVITIGDHVLGAVYRIGNDWRTNVSRGARTRVCQLAPELVAIAGAAAKAVGGGILGIDLVEDRDGRLFVLEVNHTVEFAGFQAAHDDRIDVAAAVVRWILRCRG